MKFIHLSDLHLGRSMNGYNLTEDQDFILKRIINIIYDEAPDGVLIAGDIYHSSQPSAEAVKLFDNFLTKLAERKINTFVISGNHDSPEKLSFGSRIMDNCGIHIARTYNDEISPFSLQDEYGTVDIYLLPFIRPANVIPYCQNILTYSDAVQHAISKMNINPANRNILVTHQFVTGAIRSDSELSIGGTDNIDASVFDQFDYVALGHIHSPQNCGSEKIRYCGTPLKYSLSEKTDKKSVTVITLAEKGNITYKTIPLIPLHKLVELKGSYEEIARKKFYEFGALQDDYIQITLTDENEIPYAFEKLKTIYHRILSLGYDNKRTNANSEITKIKNIKSKSPLDLFSELYELQNNQPLSDVQTKFIIEMIDKLTNQQEGVNYETT